MHIELKISKVVGHASAVQDFYLIVCRFNIKFQLYFGRRLFSANTLFWLQRRSNDNGSHSINESRFSHVPDVVRWKIKI